MDDTEEANNTLKNGQAFTFKVTGIQQKKDNSEIYISLSFFSSPRGYHMAIRVDANGDGTNDNVGSYVSVYALLLEGKYDTELSWLFVERLPLHC